MVTRPQNATHHSLDSKCLIAGMAADQAPMALVLFMGELGYRQVQWEVHSDTYSLYTARIPSTSPLAVFGRKMPKGRETR